MTHRLAWYVVAILAPVSLWLTFRWGPSVISALTIVARNFELLPTPMYSVRTAPVGEAVLYIQEPPGCPCPAVVLSLGVAPLPPDDPAVRHLLSSLAAAGFFAVLVTTPDLERGDLTPGAVDAIAAAFDWTATQPDTRGRPVVGAGLSVGASLMTVAAGRATHAPAAIFWFGGYADARTMLEAILCGRPGWEPSETAQRLARRQVENAVGKTVEQPCSAIAAIDPTVLAALSPAEPSVMASVPASTRLYLLHDRGDSYVPASETALVARALRAAGRPPEYLETGIFEHVMPRGVDPGAIPDLLGLVWLVARFLDTARG